MRIVISHATMAPLEKDITFKKETLLYIVLKQTPQIKTLNALGVRGRQRAALLFLKFNLLNMQIFKKIDSLKIQIKFSILTCHQTSLHNSEGR